MPGANHSVRAELSDLFPFSTRRVMQLICADKQEAEMTEARKTTAQYLNGLAVAVLATAGGAYLGNHAPAAILLLAGLVSLAAHALAVWVVKG